MGDFMIDVAWVVNDYAAPTAQQHGDAVPRARATPEHQSERLGGAGSIATSLAMLGYEVDAVGRWNAEDQDRLEGMRPPAARHGFRLMALDSTVTTVKFRVYVQRGGELPLLQYRFDQDPSNTYQGSLPPNLWSSERPYDAVVVMDFGKGLVTRALLQHLAADHQDIPWFVDTKNPETVKFLGANRLSNYCVLALNRSELVATIRSLDPGSAVLRRIPVGPAMRLPRHEIELEDAIAQALTVLKTHSPSTKQIIAKLDVDGAIALRDGEFFRTPPSSPRSNFAGVGAGDAFMMSIVDTFVKQAPTAPTTMQWLSNAHAAAISWLRYSEIDFWHRRQTHLGRTRSGSARLADQPSIAAWAEAWNDSRTRIPVPSLLGNADKVKRNRDSFFELEDMLSARYLPLEHGMKVVGSYIATDPNTREMLRHIAGEMLDYFELPDPKRPLSYLISARPGSGKSFLVSELTRAVEGEFIEVNMSQMASINDLQNAIADVASIYSEARRPVLFIDEADSLVGGEHALGLLLSVVWESRVRVFPRTFQLPRRLVIVMVVSTTLESLDDVPKGPDLRSRINGAELQLPELQPLDRALLAGIALKRHKPGIVEVERGFFDMVAEARVSARDIESFIVRIRSSNRGLLTLRDIDEDLAIRHGFKPTVWASPRGRSTVRVL